MEEKNKRRSFLKKIALGGIGATIAPTTLFSEETLTEKDDRNKDQQATDKRSYNGVYKGDHLNRVAFPIGGLGAGMFCMEGTGAISHMSVRNKPDIYNEPSMFAAIHVKNLNNASKVIEGPVPQWKFFGQRGTGNGATGTTFGLPRFTNCEFIARFPFGTTRLSDTDIPLSVEIKGWSPFIPTDEDNSSLPAGALEYTFTNKSATSIEAVFSYNTKNFLAADNEGQNMISSIQNGFVLQQTATAEKPHLQASFAIFTDDGNTIVDHCWFRGGWWDPLTMAWNAVKNGSAKSTAPVEKDAPGASLYVPLNLKPGERKTIRLYMTWYVPESDLHVGDIVPDEKKDCDPNSGCCASPEDLGVKNGKKKRRKKL
ncbi:GH116 family glycosyl-hydrolase [Danxiaibacter flavus]|uniref:GH116 family glycosyl-hydrolase n=1 Tax=Danxiaibacter flavus TaxID=3049108 RepID=A0ABV3ZKW1_9BACT|nr:GH116 family glycosyl-hydrolase [Chitinophagaceae bacterium DXS]